MEFVNLHTHTNLGSMLDALNNVGDLFEKVKEKGQSAVAITDHGTMAAHFDAYKASKKTGVKFIPGCEMYFVNSYDVLDNKKTEKRKHLVLLAQNHQGYKNLLKSNFIGFENQVQVMGRIFPRIKWDVLKKYNEGIICTTACANGPLSVLINDDKFEEAGNVLLKLQKIFEDRLYLELQPHHLKDEKIDQKKINEGLIELSQKYGVSLVVGTDIHYLTQEDEKFHDVLMAINSKAPVDDPNRHRYGIDDFFVKTGEEVFDFLNKHYGESVAIEAIENTVKIANLCEEPTYIFQEKNHLPIFDPKDEEDYGEFLKWKEKQDSNLSEDKLFMRFRCIQGFKEKFSHMSKEDRDIRWKRIKDEIKVIEGNDFSSYMLIVSDFIRWAKKNNITVGPGRGSAAGAMIAYVLDIHKVDPIEYGLLFERFQNAYKKDLPDIDTDISSSGRDYVKEYCRKKYGQECCAQISNIMTYSPKSIIPSLVKSMRNVIPNLIKEGENYVGVSEKIKAAIPDTYEDEKGEKKRVKTLEKALELSPELSKFAERCPELMDYAKKFVGLPSTFSTHAAALIIADQPIINIAPLRVDKFGVVSVQYEKQRSEELGLIKMDLLSISTLDVIDDTIKNILKINPNSDIRSIDDIPLNDKNTFKMIQNGDTKCVFQLGKSTVMMYLCKNIKPKNITDIAIINALGRPSSSKEERQEFIDRKFGRKPVKYLHPSLEVPLKDTFGLGVFEEQLFLIAQRTAGWDLNKADGLRKLTKLKGKDPELAEKLEIDFISGCMDVQKMKYEEAKEMWNNIVLPFAKYGFNKSHAVCYSIISYMTAYLKCNFPAEFFAAYLKQNAIDNSQTKDDDAIMAKSECKRMGVKIIPPDINKSGMNYDVIDKNTIVVGMKAIKSVGEKAVQEIFAKQPFYSFVDFLNKTEGRIISKSKIEALAKAGCFDSLQISRKFAFENGKKIREKLSAFLKKKEKEGEPADMAIEQFPFIKNDDEWNKRELLKHEQEVLGELVSGTIMDLYPGFFTQTTPLFSKLKVYPDREELIVEFVVKTMLREFKMKTGRNAGKYMIKYRVEDIVGTEIELTVWPTEYEFAKKIMLEGTPIRALCQISDFNGQRTLMLQKIEKVFKEKNFC